jgi:UDP-GlcNAc3NAcA epimerase
MPLKLLHIVGARPQFAKAAAVSRALQAEARRGAEVTEVLLHTGQHYDDNMSKVFFEELSLREPDINLQVGSGNHAQQTARTLEGIDSALSTYQPEAVIVYGDTNATLGGGLATVQRHLPLAHVEAGVRTGNLHQAEDLNRTVVDRISDFRFCCTQLNVDNLGRESLAAGTYFSGDTMLDNYLHFKPQLDASILDELGIFPGGYILATIHRAENTDSRERLSAICAGLRHAAAEIAPVVLPLHPRTRRRLAEFGFSDREALAGVQLCSPVGFNKLQALLENARFVFSDSGGLLREAYFAGKFCLIPWEYAAWPELVDAKWAATCAVEADSLRHALDHLPQLPNGERGGIFGTGEAGAFIINTLLTELGG